MLTAKDIMTVDVISVSTETSVSELAEVLMHYGISGAPVLSKDGLLIGVVTESDLIDQTKKLHIPTVLTILDSVFYLENPDKMEEEVKKMAGTNVGDICSKKIKTVTQDTPIDEIATIMAEKNYHTIPVLDGEKIVGIIGKKDIIKTFTR